MSTANPNLREPSSDLSDSLGETVWKIQMSSILGSQESAKRGEKRPYRRFTLPKTRDPNPSSDFPNSFERGILGSSRLQAGADLGSKAAACYAHYPCPPGLRTSS